MCADKPRLAEWCQLLSYDPESVTEGAVDVFQLVCGHKIRRAAEGGLRPFLDDPEVLQAELLRQIVERAN